MASLHHVAGLGRKGQRPIHFAALKWHGPSAEGQIGNLTNKPLSDVQLNVAGRILLDELQA